MSEKKQDFKGRPSHCHAEYLWHKQFLFAIRKNFSNISLKFPSLHSGMWSFPVFLAGDSELLLLHPFLWLQCHMMLISTFSHYCCFWPYMVNHLTLLKALRDPSRDPFCQRDVFDPKDSHYWGMQTACSLIYGRDVIPILQLPSHLPGWRESFLSWEPLRRRTQLHFRICYDN